MRKIQGIVFLLADQNGEKSNNIYGLITSNLLQQATLFRSELHAP